jgi:uncharacterized phage protein gp47/JayE
MPGLIATGFDVPTLQDLIDIQVALYQSQFSASIDVSEASPFGQLAAINAERELLIWQGLQAVWAAFTTDGATGASLDQLAGLTGSVRRAAAPSTVTATLSGTPATLIPAGSVASVTGTGARFVTLADATIGGGGTVSAAIESQEDGAIVAAAGTLTVIETPISGWTGVTNPLDAVLGNDVESDAAFRVRREQEIRAIGNAAVESIRASLLQVASVTQAAVFENATDVTDADGVPPHSVECLVQGGADADIRESIFASKAAGIRAYGSTTGTVTDSQGFSHEIDFTRPSTVDIYVGVELIIDANEYPSDGDAQIEAALVAYGDAQRMGKNVVASALESRCFTIPGVLEAICKIGTSASPTLRTTIAINLRQIADLDTGRISVTTTPGTP